jgi:hypothetical protein
MSQTIAAPFKRTEGQTLWVVFMATVGGWVLTNLTVFIGTLVWPLDASDSEGVVVFYRLWMGLWGVVPWIPFLVVYLLLTPLFKNRLGGWIRTQLIVTLMSLVGGFVLLAVLPRVIALVVRLFEMV